MMSRFHLLAALTLAGCVGYHAQLLSPQHSAAELEARRLSGARVWDLENLTEAAFLFQPDLELARAQLGTARATLITAGERPNPTLTLSPQFGTPLKPLMTQGTYG